MGGIGAAEQLVKPKLRGVVHELGFYAAAAVGVVLVVTADPGFFECQREHEAVWHGNGYAP